MIIIKRYPNRKLYNTEEKKYVTLDGIAQLIKEGEDVQVVDHTTGNDITALTLAQIIYDQEKKQSGSLPNSILTGIIQARGEGINAFQKAISASRAYWNQIDDEIRLRIQGLVRQGEITEIEGRKLLEKLLGQPILSSKKDTYQERVQEVLDRRQVPTKNDLQDLVNQLENLTEKIERITEGEEE